MCPRQWRLLHEEGYSANGAGEGFGLVEGGFGITHVFGTLAVAGKLGLGAGEDAEHGDGAELALLVGEEAAGENIAEEVLLQELLGTGGEALPLGLGGIGVVSEERGAFLAAEALAVGVGGEGLGRGPHDVGLPGGLALGEHLGEGGVGVEAAGEAEVGVELDEDLLDFVHRKPGFETGGAGAFEAGDVAGGGAAGEAGEGGLAGGEHLRLGGTRLGGGVIGVADRFQPGILVGLGVALDGEMGEPAVGGRAVPVVGVGRDLDDVAGLEPAGRFAAFLVEPLAGDADEDLTAGVAVPVVAATGLKGNIGDGDAGPVGMFGEAREVALALEVPGVSVVRRAGGKGGGVVRHGCGSLEYGDEEGGAKDRDGLHGVGSFLGWFQR